MTMSAVDSLAVAQATVGVPALRARRISKTYATARVLNNVDLDIAQGSTHCLLGGNGSGKSTFVKILAGLVEPDVGGLLSIGHDIEDASSMTPDAAKDAHVSFVHQHPALFADMTIAENLALARPLPHNRLGALKKRVLVAEAAETLARLHVAANPKALVSSLRPATRTMVAIARALHDSQDARGLLVLDEPTASLPAQEVSFLLDTLERCVAGGQSILYITHHLDEVLRIADDCTVLRDGSVNASARRGEFDRGQLVTWIAGSQVVQQPTSPSALQGQPAVLAVENLNVGRVTDASLVVHAGEIVGLAGLQGSGRSTILRGLSGAQAIDAGTVDLNGRTIAPRGLTDAIKMGITMVPEDRANDAAFADLSVEENLLIGRLGTHSRLGTIIRRSLKRAARDAIARFGVKVTDDQQLMSRLSGGNQQKVVLARALANNPSLLLLDEPTQGVDIGARTEIYALLRNAANESLAVLVASSDDEELTLLCDRVFALRAGQIVGELEGSQLTTSNIAHLIFSEDTED
jgi:ribose transport system ATP-binding protein